MPQTSDAGEASEQFITSGDMYSMVLEQKFVIGYFLYFYIYANPGSRTVSE